jgi:crotonobetainyl-CoA:carnitine CoA-transferase CaiB-like acyl-CoA transferase
VQPLAGALVVDLSRYLPGPFASRELLRLGARVVRVEPPNGDPLRRVAPVWDAALNAGKESVVCDLKSTAGLELAQALCDRADVVLDGFRPRVVERLGLKRPERAVWCSVTGFGSSGPHAARAGHDLNYLGWAGALDDTAPAVPPLQIADLAAGGLAACVEILAALLERGRTGRGARLEISMTHGSHRLVAHRAGGDPAPRFLTGGMPCYRMYATADGRWLTVGALEPKFWARLCELLGRSDLVERQLEPAAADELADIFAARPLDEWLARFEGEDVCVGPVSTLAEATAAFGDPCNSLAQSPRLGEHTAAWQEELALPP